MGRGGKRFVCFGLFKQNARAQGKGTKRMDYGFKVSAISYISVFDKKVNCHIIMRFVSI